MTKTRTISTSRFVAACETAGISVSDAQSHCRLKILAHKRFHVMAILRDQGFSFPRIGLVMGGRDHSSTWHGVRRWAEIQKAAQ